MIKTILAPLTGYGSDRSVLDAAVAIAKDEKSHIECLHVRMDTTEAAAWAASVAPLMHDNLKELGRKFAQDEQERSKRCQAAFQDVCKRHALKVNDNSKKMGDVSVFFRELTGSPDETIHLARVHDLTILARTPELLPERIDDVLMKSGRPVLLAPAKPVNAIAQNVAIAWKDGPDAARAVMAASSLLTRAKRVTILSVTEIKGRKDKADLSAQRLQAQMRWHGVQAEIKAESCYALPASNVLLEMAYGCNADLLVMGGYGHSRMREFVLGGVTRDILNACEIPVFMLH